MAEYKLNTPLTDAAIEPLKAGALLSNSIVESRGIAFDELGPEAIREMKVKDFPLLVINDRHGGELCVKPDLEAALKGA